MRIRERLTYANVAATLALVLAVAGMGGSVAYAHGKIGPKDIKKNAIKSKHIKKGKVKSKDLKNNNVKSKDIKDGHVRDEDLAGDIDGMAMAAVTVDEDGNVTNSFNRLGSEITAAKVEFADGTLHGHYKVWIPGLTGSLEDRIIGVTGQETAGGGAAHCGPGRTSNAYEIPVRCHTYGGSQANTGFSLWVMN